MPALGARVVVKKAGQINVHVRVHVQLWVTVARDHACLKAELQAPLFSSAPTTAYLISTPVHQGPLRAGRLRISTSASQGPLRAGRLRISTSASQGPLRAADCASLVQPSRSAEGRRLRISTPTQQGPLRDEDCTSTHKEGMCKIFCCWAL